MLVVKHCHPGHFCMKKYRTNFYLQPFPLTVHYLFLFSEKNNHIPPPYTGEKVAQGSKQTFLPHGKYTERENFLKGKGLSKMKNILFPLLSARHRLWTEPFAVCICSWPGLTLGALAFVFTSSKYLSLCSVTSFWVTTITNSDPLHLISLHNNMFHWKCQRGAADAPEVSIPY